MKLMVCLVSFCLLLLSLNHVNGMGLLMDPWISSDKGRKRERDKIVTLPGNNTYQCLIPIFSHTMIYGLIPFFFIMSQYRRWILTEEGKTHLKGKF